jgi:hypothetical protein
VSSSVPQWITEYIRQCQERLGLQAWNIKVTLTDIPNRHHNNSVAITSTIAGSMSAYMRFKDDIAPDHDGYVTITHEMLHLVFARLDWSMDAGIETLPKKHRRAVYQMYNPHYETGIDHLAEMLAPAWMPAVEEQSKSDG